MRRALAGVSALTALGALLAISSPSSAIGSTATPATLSSTFAAAGPGTTIELASGDYGTFRGAMKSGMVTLAPQAGASVTMQLDFAPASNITIDGVTITKAEIGDSRTRNIVIRNSDIPGQVTLRTSELANSNILLERNVHRDFDVCSSCGEGRVFLPGDLDQPSGITIRDSDFRGGLSDGIQNGSNGTQIINNTFHAIEPGSPEGVHADAIQLYGSRNTVIRGNYFYDQPEVPAIMAADGANHELIEDNVIAGSTDGYPYITMFSDNGSIIRHNTFADGDCAFNLPCGILRLGSKSGDPVGQGTVVEDNILSEIAVESGTLARRSHNLIAHDRPAGTAEIAGSPTYVGGAVPTSYAGYRLADGSKGERAASDGLDIGARIDGDRVPPVIGTADPSHPVSGGQGAGPEARAGECDRANRKVDRLKRALRRADRRPHRRKLRGRLRRAREARRDRCRGADGLSRLSFASDPAVAARAR